MGTAVHPPGPGELCAEAPAKPRSLGTCGLARAPSRFGGLCSILPLDPLENLELCHQSAKARLQQSDLLTWRDS